MNKRLKFIIFGVILSILCVACKAKKDEITKAPTVTPAMEENADIIDEQKNINSNLLEVTNYFEQQDEIDLLLLEEVEKGYSFEEPLVIVNPYGNSPLTAVAIFSTEEVTGGTVLVKGIGIEDNMAGRFKPDKNHIVPIYGLYPAATTEVVITQDNGSTSTLMINTEPNEIEPVEADITVYDSTSYDYSQLTFVSNVNGSIYALDSKGNIRWYYDQEGVYGVKPLNSGRLILSTELSLESTFYKSAIKEIDLLGKVYNEYVIPGEKHCDVFEMKNGNIMVAGRKDDLEKEGDYILEIDYLNGDLIWELDLDQLIDFEEGAYSYDTKRNDPANSEVWNNDERDIVLLSAQDLNAIVGINKSEKTLKWIIGNPEGWSNEYLPYFLTPVGNDFTWPLAASEATMLSNGDIMCFDNGVYPRVVVYRVNEYDMTIEQAWQYGKEWGQELYTEGYGNVISLEKDLDNIWITAGSNAVQVKEGVKTLYINLNHLAYRTFRLSPYDDIGNYDVNHKGEYKGGQGETSMADMDIDITDAVLNEDLMLSLYPTKLNLKASYNIAEGENIGDSYIILHREDGTLYSYPVNQEVSGENETLVNVDGWVTTQGIEGASYDVFVVLGGSVYNTGYKIEL